MTINRPLQFNWIANSLAWRWSTGHCNLIALPTHLSKNFPLSKVNTSLFPIFIGFSYAPFGFALISPPLQLLSLIGHFQICLGDHPGEIKVAPQPSFFVTLSFSMKLTVRLTHASVIISFCHHLGKAPGRNQRGPSALFCLTKGHHWESTITLLPIKSTWATPNCGQQSAKKIHLGYPQSWLAISRKGFKQSWQPSFSKSAWFFQCGW